LVQHESWLARQQNYGGSWTYNIGANVVNNFVFGYNRENSATLTGVKQSWADLGAVGVPTPTENIEDIGGVFCCDFNLAMDRHTFNVADTVSMTKGRHLIVAGVNVLQNYALEHASWLADPLMTFNGSVSGSFYSDLLLGYLSQFEQGGGEYNQYHGREWSAFGQDTIRLKPNLTLTLGIRWEPWTPLYPIPAAHSTTFSQGVQSTVYPNAPTGLVYPGDPGIPTGDFWPQYKDDFTPRVGIVWQPHMLPNTVLRAAFGTFVNPLDFASYYHMSANDPFSPTYIIDPINVAPNPLLVSNPWEYYAPTGGRLRSHLLRCPALYPRLPLSLFFL